MTETTSSAKDMLARLVGFDTTSHLSNRALIDFVADYLRAHGAVVEVLPNSDGTKANLYATLGPDTEGGVVLSGHTDVVPVEGQDWATDPFVLTEKDGLVYGRGTADMKGFAAAVLASVPRFAAAGLKRPIHIALSHDEEVGCLGVRPMIDHVIAHRPRPALCIVGEPTSMRVVNAHKGIRTLMTRIRGREGHSSRTDLGASAILATMRLITFLDELRREMIERGDPSGRFEPPYTTLSVGEIHGGTAVNIIPRDCWFTWEYRTLPTTDPEEIRARFDRFAQTQVLPDLLAVASEATIETTDIANAPGLAAEPESPAEALALYLAEENDVSAVSYGTEAGLFQAQAIPTIVCGPGDINQAHKPDEFIALAQLDACMRFLGRLDTVCRQQPTA